MKKSYNLWVFCTLFLFGFFSGFAQESPQKPIKKLKVFNESQRVPLSNIQKILTDDLKVPPGNTFVFISEKVDDLGFVHKEYQQFYNNIPVEFGKTVFHAENNVVQSMSNNIFRIENLSTVPSLNSEAALVKAMNVVKAEEFLWQNKKEAELIGYEKPEGKLVVFPALKNVSKSERLAYKFDIYATSPIAYRADVYIDAHTGEFIMENKKIHHANTPATGTSSYNGTVSFTADSYSGQYRLRQTANGSGIQTYDLNGSTSYNNASDIVSNSTSFTNNATGVQAHWG
ncbi:MAG TPA: hypothetical protein VFM70_06115, partial [Salinimicrobium sp.]|nr:hypothetical protein [Salinimicrobium sp.]